MESRARYVRNHPYQMDAREGKDSYLPALNSPEAVGGG